MALRLIEQLRVYQCKCIEFLLSHLFAGLFLDMGLGKTISALTAIVEFLRFGVGPTLVVGPIRVIETVWRQEAKAWNHTKHLTFSLIRGNVEQRRAAMAVKADIYLVNPEHLTWLFEQIPGNAKWPWEVLFIDESSMFKNVGSKRFKNLRFKIKNFTRRYILTGTPTPNRLLELWPQIFLLDGGQRLGSSFTRFKQRYFEPVDRWGYKVVPRHGAKERIYNLIADLVLRMDAKDYLDLPKVQVNRVLCPLDDKVMKTYRSVEQDAFAKLEGMTHITALNVIGAMIKCRQIANGVVYTDTDGEKGVSILHSEKLDAAREIVDETGSPVIIVYNFQHELALLKEQFKDLNPVVLNESKDAVKTVNDWNAGKIELLLLHPKSGGHGLNLQIGGHVMIWFGLTFSFEEYIQTIARINRQGQTKPVMLHLLIAPGTIDELLEAVLKGKQDGQDDLFSFLKAYRRKELRRAA